MRAIFAGLLGVLIAAGAANAGTWKITKDHWDRRRRRTLRRIRRRLRRTRLHEARQPVSRARPTPTATPIRRNCSMDGDCADFIYQLRAYFAVEERPAVFLSALRDVALRARRDDFRFSDAGNMIVARLQLEWQPDADPVKLLRELRGTVSTAMFRVEHVYDRGFHGQRLLFAQDRPRRDPRRHDHLRHLRPRRVRLQSRRRRHDPLRRLQPRPPSHARHLRPAIPALRARARREVSATSARSSSSTTPRTPTAR